MHHKVTGPTRVITAEFIGTFSLIFIGAGAAIALGATMILPWRSPTA